MPRSYCSTNDVKQYLPPNVVTEGDNPIPNFRNPTPESASNINLDFFIQQASAEIDAIWSVANPSICDEVSADS